MITTDVEISPFGDEKRFIKVDHCVTLAADGVAMLREITGEVDTRTLTQDNPRPKCVANAGDILLVLRGINVNDGAEADDMVSVRVWLDDNTFIASQNRDVASVDSVIAALPSMQHPMDAMMMLIDELFGRIERHVFDLDEQVDEAEEQALDDPDKARRLEIMEFRRTVIALRRYLLPQRETMLTLSRSKCALLSDDQRQLLTDQYYRSARICDLLDAIRERLTLIQEEITAVISDRMNQNMYVLSIISLIFLPLGFLTGLFGINVGGMPGVAGGETAMEPFAFWLVVAGCFVVSGFIVVLMKKKRWI